MEGELEVLVVLSRSRPGVWSGEQAAAGSLASQGPSSRLLPVPSQGVLALGLSQMPSPCCRDSLTVVSTGTEKVRQAQECRHLHVVSPDWLWSCLERWDKVEEQLFPLTEDDARAHRWVLGHAHAISQLSRAWLCLISQRPASQGIH